MSAEVRVELPASLCHLAKCPHELQVTVPTPATQRAVLDALEQRYPMLTGCVREHETGRRRPFIRFFACGLDVSHAHPDEPLPPPVIEGREVFLILGAIAGG